DRVQAMLYQLLAAGPRVGVAGDRPAQGAGDRPQGLEGGGEPQLLQRLGEQLRRQIVAARRQADRDLPRRTAIDLGWTSGAGPAARVETAKGGPEQARAHQPVQVEAGQRPAHPGRGRGAPAANGTEPGSEVKGERQEGEM